MTKSRSDLETLSAQWWEALGEVLNADERWLAVSKWFDGRVQFNFESDSASLEIRGGRVVAVSQGASARGANVVLSAPRTEWERLIAGETDWFRGTSPGLGEIHVSGDVVSAMRNSNTMWLTLEAMKRVEKDTAAAPAPSPEPRPTGREITGRYITVKGIRTYYEEAGDGPVILCLHAASQDSMMYRHVLEGLSDEYRVIALDAPGHCKTLMPPDGPFTTITQHAEFNEAFVEALGLDRPAIIGCSFAGNQVLQLASRKPGGYPAVVSAEGADYTPAFTDFVLDMMRVDGHQMVYGYSESLTGPRTPADRSREVMWQIQRNPVEIMVSDLVGYGNFDERDNMGKIDSPVLLIRGDADWLVSQEQVEATHSRIPGSEIAILAGTGHYPMIENPYEFNEIVREFLHKVKYI